MVPAGLALALLTVLGCAHPDIGSELPDTPLSTLTLSAAKAPESPAPVPIVPAPPAPNDKPLPINLATALQLAGARPIDIDLAVEAHRSAAPLERAEVLWLPTIYLGTDYFRHDGQMQSSAGDVSGTSKSSFMIGTFPTQSLPSPMRSSLRWPSDRPSEHARRLSDGANDSLLAVAEAYFNVQQARGELAGALDAAHRAADVLRQTEKLYAGGEGILADVDVVRAHTEVYREQTLETARERWRLASADLARLLRLDPSALVEPLESAQLRVTLIHRTNRWTT